jgi:hypothetical protein
METSHIILLVVSASISFAVGRVIMHMRKIKKMRRKSWPRKRLHKPCVMHHMGQSQKTKANENGKCCRSKNLGKTEFN